MMTYQNYNHNYTLNLLTKKWKMVNKYLNGFIEKQRLNKCLLNIARNIQSQRRVSFKFIHPEKLHLVRSEQSVLSISVISQSSSNP